MSAQSICVTVFPSARIGIFWAAIAILSSVAQGQTLYSSGPMTWQTGDTNWGTMSGGPYNTATWANWDYAVFERTTGAVTVSGDVDANGITFNQTGYSLSGGTLTLGNLNPIYIYVQSGGKATIKSLLDASGAAYPITFGSLGYAGTLDLSGSVSSVPLRSRSITAPLQWAPELAPGACKIPP